MSRLATLTPMSERLDDDQREALAEMPNNQEEAEALCIAAGIPKDLWPDVTHGIGDIYFVYSPHMKVIKIGFSFDLAKRLKALQTGSSAPLVLLGKMRGTQADERALHRKFDKQRLAGEWFKDGKRLRTYIERVAK